MTNLVRMPFIFLIILLSNNAFAGYKIKINDQFKLNLGIRAVVQFEDNKLQIDNEENITDSEISFRRLRPYIKANIGKDWQGKLAWEISSGRQSIKDIYMRYKGFNWLDIKLGNETLPFSRERMTSSAKQQLPERTLVGDTEFGIPGRQPGIHLKTKFDVPLTFYLAHAKANIHGDLLTEIQFIGHFENSDIPERLQDIGEITVARIDYNLWQGAKYNQGFLAKSKTGLTFSLASYKWKNKKTVVEIEDVEGIEASISYRGHNLSLDTQFNEITANSPFKLERPLFNLGEARLEQSSTELGYMLWSNKLEVVISNENMQADSWKNEWRVKEFGFNYFLSGHDHKLQLSYRKQTNIKGKSNRDKSIFLQWQYAY